MLQELLPEICAELGITCLNLSRNWVHLLTYKNQKRFIIGGNFDLNSAASAAIASDKVATYQVLDAHKVPAIPHYMVLNDNFTHNLPFKDIASLKDAIQSLPVVVKPLRGYGGRSVSLCKTQSEAKEAALALLNTEGSCCISPYVDSVHEYRAFFLDDKILYIYQKTRKAGSFRHNLSSGARPELMSQDSELYSSLSTLASAAGKALGLRFATIDMLITTEGPKVLEINRGVYTDVFSKSVPGGREIAKNIYRKAIAKLFDISS